jgi:polyhydroxyalkanoate synthase
MNLVWDYFSLWQHSMMRWACPSAGPGRRPEKGDKRFKDEEWEEHFLFDFIKQSYLIAARHIHDTVSGVDGLDDQTQKKVNFFTRQYIDALSPSNFALTNPEVFRETVKSHGQNLIKGLNNLLRDVEDGDGNLRVKMTDTSAFELGKNVATTPGKVVFQNDMMQLLQYNPSTGQVQEAAADRAAVDQQVLHPRPAREELLHQVGADQGHTVFVISWVNPDEKPGREELRDYLLEGTAGRHRRHREADRREASTLAGYCLGGTLLTTLAYMAAKKDKRIASATFFTTMTRLLRAGRTGRVHRRRPGLQPRKEDVRARLPRRLGNGRHLQHAARQRPDLVLRGQQLPDGQGSVPVRPAVLELRLHPHAGEDAQLLPAQHVHGNLLKEPGGIIDGGVKIDLSKIKVPCYFISTIEDHIAPWKSTYMGARLPSAATGALRAGRLRPHRRHRQPAGGQQVRLLDQASSRFLTSRPSSVSPVISSSRLKNRVSGSSWRASNWR